MTAIGQSIFNFANFSISLNRDYYHKQFEIVDWCRTHYGPNRAGRWEWVEAFGTTFFYFKNEPDYNWFILRWISSE
jgi:hypothetical protein